MTEETEEIYVSYIKHDYATYIEREVLLKVLKDIVENGDIEDLDKTVKFLENIDDGEQDD